MHAASNPHPTPEQLSAFDAGRLPAHERDAVERHVAGCPDCRRALEALARADSGQGEAPAADDSSQRWAVPEELVGHPRYRVLGVPGAAGWASSTRPSTSGWTASWR
jgi:anti-sigma factor RsiW